MPRLSVHREGLAAVLAAAAAACASPYVHYARLLDEEVDFGEVEVGSSATRTARVENLTSEEAHVYFLPPAPFSASVESESGDEYVPVDIDEHIPVAAGEVAEIALTYTCEEGDEGAFDGHVVVVAGPESDGPWTATQEVGRIRLLGACVLH